MKIYLGIAAFYHDAAACLVKDGKVISAAEEERFTGIKHDDSFPINSINWLLSENNLEIKDIDLVCWYENPKLKEDRIIKTFDKRPFRTLFNRLKFRKRHEIEGNIPKLLEDRIGYFGDIVYTDHHLSHTAFSYLTSPYKESAIITVDGVGEWETLTISHAKGRDINKLVSIDFPNSLGMLYSTMTAYLGFAPNEGEYKVMGLAAFGKPSKYKSKLKKIFNHKNNKFYIDQKYFTWEYSDKIMFNSKFVELLGVHPRLKGEPITDEHKHLAAALQSIYEDEFLKVVKHAKKITKSDNLCLGGGCAYNGVANSKAYKYFKSIHIPFAPSDAGSAIGACLYNYDGKLKDNTSPFLGPKFSNKEIKVILDRYDDIKFQYLSESKLLKKVAKIINDGNVIGWVQGQMEFGARALGNRSILASPIKDDIKDRINAVIKKREMFRPFAPSCIQEKANKYFKMNESIPYMNQVVSVKKPYNFPSITHVDNTARVQTVNKKQNRRYYLLLKEIEKISTYPICLNTSFNLKDQTITTTPNMAIDRFLDSEMNFLIVGNYIVSKNV